MQIESGNIISNIMSSCAFDSTVTWQIFQFLFESLVSEFIKMQYAIFILL